MNNSHDMDSKSHIEMWKHYDNLRQAKNNGFLTTNSILVAIVGFLLREPRPFIFFLFIVLISVVGLLVCVSWFLLLTRNYAYIKHHRDHAAGGNWKPGNRLLPGSQWTERTPSAAFVALWIGVLVFVTSIHR